MLKEFRVKNFKGFNDEFVFKLDQVREYGFNNECIKNNLVNKAVVYGENSSGKSNLGFAIMDISLHLFDGARIMPYSTYLNLDSTESEASFTYIFKFDEDIIEYYYKKDSTRKLTFEQIKENGNLLFQYNYVDNKMINKIPNTSTIKLENNIANISMVKFIYNNSDLDKKSPIYRIVDFASNMLWFRSVRNFEFIAPNIQAEDINEFIIKNNLIADLEKFFNKNKLNYKLDKFNHFGKEILVAKYNNGIAPLTDVASTGTMSLWLFFYWMHKNSNISFLFIDEFDAFYHFDLSKDILLNVLNNSSYQAVLTTHNTFLLDNGIMRPDCYFVINNNKILPISDKTNKVIRQGHNLEKMMISGEFE